MLRNIDDASRQLSEFVGAKPFDHSSLIIFLTMTRLSIVSDSPLFLPTFGMNTIIRWK